MLPNVLYRHAPVEAVIGCTLGIVLMFGIKEWTRRLSSKHYANVTGLPMELTIGIGVVILIDGLLLGIGFAAGAKQGALLAFALTREFISPGEKESDVADYRVGMAE